MVKKNTKTNPNLIQIIRDLKDKSHSEDVAIWMTVARKLERSTRRQGEVNISKINRYSKDGDTVLIPGKVLSNGILEHKVDVVGLKFSEVAREKIETAGGKCLSILEIVEQNPKGSNIIILE
ncbi:MAG: 50S ribosomal protein L18e [Methanobrevibacter sp.]|jgi:large subunit ribosomal protein L18e|nr:50S ribosomal protein L18e [Candidatus Methanoflexus mossambicus]